MIHNKMPSVAGLTISQHSALGSRKHEQIQYKQNGPFIICSLYNSERSSNSRSEFASSLYSRKQVTFLYSLQLKFLRKPHHRNFRHFNACVVHIFVLLKMKTVAILFLQTDIHIDKSGMYLRQKQPITFPENCVRRVG